MANKNKDKGTRFEREYLRERPRILSYRFYSSVGPVWRNSEFDGTPCRPIHHAPIDSFYIDDSGVHFVQNKYGITPFPDTEEMLDLLLLQMDLGDKATVELATKYPRQNTLIWRFRDTYHE